MRDVAGAAVDHSARRVQVDPVQEAQEGLLDAASNRRVAQDVEQLLHREDRLADRLDEPVLALPT